MKKKTMYVVYVYAYSSCYECPGPEIVGVGVFDCPPKFILGHVLEVPPDFTSKDMEAYSGEVRGLIRIAIGMARENLIHKITVKNPKTLERLGKYKLKEDEYPVCGLFVEKGNDLYCIAGKIERDGKIVPVIANSDQIIRLKTDDSMDEIVEKFKLHALAVNAAPVNGVFIDAPNVVYPISGSYDILDENNNVIDGYSCTINLDQICEV